jgi:flagellar biosynthesis protein FlhA
MGGDLLDRVKSLRRKLALDLGHRPAARAHPRQPRPAAAQLRIKVHGVEVGRGEAPSGAVLASATTSPRCPA